MKMGCPPSTPAVVSRRKSAARKILLPVLMLAMLKIGLFIQLMPFGGSEALHTIMLDSSAEAQEEAASEQKPVAPVEDAAKADNQTSEWNEGVDVNWKYELVLALQKREKQIRIQEQKVRQDALRLEELKSDLDKRIQALAMAEKRITDLLAQKQTIEEEKMRKLAKVFEETPAEQAGPLLSKLDVDIAAMLLLKMNGRKAGRIWGFVVPDRAVQISKELARLKPGLDMNAMGGQ